MTTAPCFLGGSASGGDRHPGFWFARILKFGKEVLEFNRGDGLQFVLVRGLAASPARFICSHEKPARKAASLFLIPIHQPWEEKIRERRQQFPPQAS